MLSCDNHILLQCIASGIPQKCVLWCNIFIVQIYNFNFIFLFKIICCIIKWCFFILNYLVCTDYLGDIAMHRNDVATIWCFVEQFIFKDITIHKCYVPALQHTTVMVTQRIRKNSPCPILAVLWCVSSLFKWMNGNRLGIVHIHWCLEALHWEICCDF